MFFLQQQLKRMARSVRQRQQVADLPLSATALKAWFDAPAGKRILAQEQMAIDQALSCLFGYHLLQMSILPSTKLYQSSRICHCVRVGFKADEPADLASALDTLPLANESVDVTLLHHVLEYSANPHQLLNEVSRVTIAHGHVVIVGFDPVSLTGAIKPFAQITNTSAFWSRHSLARGRINDWLKLLGFEAKQAYVGCSQTPLINREPRSKLGRRLNAKAQLPFGHFYCIVARKMVASIRPNKPVWDARFLKGVKLAPQPITARGAARLSLIRNVRAKAPRKDPPKI